MERYAYIPEIKGGVVFSDPYYDSNAQGQFRSQFNAQDWFMRLDSKSEGGYTDFTMYLGRRTMMHNTSIKLADDGAEDIAYPSIYDAKSVELNVGNTAQIYCGSKENWDHAREFATIPTGVDGTIGGLVVLTCRGESDPAGFIFIGALDESIGNEDALFRHLLFSFDGEEITQEQYMNHTQPNTLLYHMIMSEELRHANQINEKSQPLGNPERDEPDI